MDIIPKDRDFFISYAARDRLWAEWIAWQLANAGYATIADWEFLPGTNRVLQAQTAIARAKGTIAVLSNAYVTSQNSRDEWTTVTKLDPTGHDRRLIPVVVESVQTTGFLATVVCIELVDLDEIKARERLLSALRAEKAKPASAPIFPRVIPAVSAPFPPLEHFLNIVVVDADDEPVPETTVKVFKGDILIAESVTNGNPLKIVVSERPQDLRVEAVSGAHKVEMPIRTTDSQCKIRFSNLRRKRVPVQPVSEEQPVPLIIACPIIAEYEIMSRSLTKHQQVGADGPLIATIGQLGRHRVVCVQTGKGETETAAALQWALGKWKSRWVLLVGIAGGFPEQKVRRGDVVVATFVYNFDFGKIEDKRFIRRPELDFQSDRKLLAYANLVAVRRAVTWTDTIRETRPDKEPNTASKLSFGYIGSSNKVIDDPSYESFREVQRGDSVQHPADLYCQRSVLILQIPGQRGA